jgi:hypothetical protein
MTPVHTHTHTHTLSYSIADRAFEVAKRAKELEEKYGRPQVDAGVQCNFGPAEPFYRKYA